MKYKRSNTQLKHMCSWLRAVADRKGIEMLEFAIQEGTNGLVLCCKGLVMEDKKIRLGNRYENHQCMTQVTWSYNGTCRDWRLQRLPQFDLEIKETPEERREGLESWGSHKYDTNSPQL